MQFISILYINKNQNRFSLFQKKITFIFIFGQIKYFQIIHFQTFSYSPLYADSYGCYTQLECNVIFQLFIQEIKLLGHIFLNLIFNQEIEIELKIILEIFILCIYQNFY